MPERVHAAASALWNREAATATRSLVRDFRPDVAHVHKAYVQLSVSPIFTCHQLGVPIVQTAHDYEFISASPFDTTGRRWDRDEQRFSYRAVNSATFVVRRRVHKPRVSKWIAVSEALARHYRERGGINCTVIPNFTAPSAGSPQPRAQRRGVLYLGRLSPEKGIGHVLQAAARLKSTPFTIAGQGPLAEEVARTAAELPNLEYRGFVDRQEARSLISGAVACLLPSTWEEPAGLSCLEAMAEATPVIAYPSGGMAEYVSTPDAGIVCSRPEVDDLVEAIRLICSQGSLWDSYSRRGLAGAASRHSLPTYLDALEGVYRSATGEAEPSRPGSGVIG